ncbi:response regulator transcription factor [Roseivirga sp.]|uniref:response regulator transcription factor n=1 Tax=Roseivirga sp. TaxID=1964215 RepID=UPI003B8D994F
MSKVLLVEDELSLAMLVKDNLEEQGYKVTHVSDGQAAIERFNQETPDLIILDVMMPKVNGYDVAKAIRTTNKNVPIIFLTAKVQVKDVIEGFESGGNDYLRKPFSIQELLIRMKVMLSDTRLLADETQPEDKVFYLGSFIFDSRKFTLELADDIRNLTAKESHLLQALCMQQNQTVTKESLLLAVWGDDSFFNSRSLDVFISRLRKYLKEEPKLQILNIRGVGYKFIVD